MTNKEKMMTNNCDAECYHTRSQISTRNDESHGYVVRWLRGDRYATTTRHASPAKAWAEAMQDYRDFFDSF